MQYDLLSVIAGRVSRGEMYLLRENPGAINLYTALVDKPYFVFTVARGS